MRHLADGDIKSYKEIREEGRNMIAEARCVSCHKPEKGQELIPELTMDSPCRNAGGRLNKEWMAAWIANQKIKISSSYAKLVDSKEAVILPNSLHRMRARIIQRNSKVMLKKVPSSSMTWAASPAHTPWTCAWR